MRTVKATSPVKQDAQIIAENWLRNIDSDLSGLHICMHLSHYIAIARGWWPEGGRNVGELISLMHSELSEALEGARQDLRAEHIGGEFSRLEEELADLLHRVFDLAAAAKLDLARAFAAKAKYNMVRKDHDLKVRADGGKQF